MKTLLFAFSAILTVSFVSKAQTIEEGLKNLNAERYIQAGKIFNDLASSNPTTENYFQLGRYYLSTPDGQSNIDKALDAFTKGNDLEKKGDPLNTIGLAWVSIAKKDFAGAKLILDEVFKKGKNAKDSDLLYRAGEGYALMSWANDPAEAIMYLDQAQEVKKEDNPEYFVARAKAFIIKNEGGDAMNALQNALSFGAKDKAFVHGLMSKIWLQGKNYEKAPESINAAIAADPTHAPAYYYLSSYLQTYQKWDEAAQAAQKYLDNGDGDCAAKLRYIKLAFTAKDFDNVLGKLKEIESCNEDPIVLRLSGISKFELGRPQEAIQDLKKFISVANKEDIYGLDYGFIGRAYLALDDESKMEENDIQAIEFMEEAIAKEDTTFDYYTTLGSYFQEKKKYEDAALFYDKAIKSKKNPSGEDWFRLGILQYQIKDWTKANESFDKVCAAYKDTWAPPYILSGRIKTYLDPTDSLYSYPERFQQYLDVLGEDGRANAANKRDIADAYKYLAGREWTVNKDIPKATALLDELLKYDPSNQEALQLKNSINGVMEETPEEGIAPADSVNTPSGR